MSEFKLTPKEARAEWVKALRSGEYKQATRQLKRSGGYCCLGVACDVFEKMESCGEWDGDKFRITSFPREKTETRLPPKVTRWLGLTSPHGGVLDERVSIACLNDSGSTFAEIADIIEAEPQGLIAEVSE